MKTANNDKKEILEIFKTLEKKAKEIFPGIEKDIETFNSIRVEYDSYLSYLILSNDQPLSKASNQSSVE